MDTSQSHSIACGETFRGATIVTYIVDVDGTDEVLLSLNKTVVQN